MPYEVLHVLASGFCIDKKRDMRNRLGEIASPGSGLAHSEAIAYCIRHGKKNQCGAERNSTLFDLLRRQADLFSICFDRLGML